MALKKMLFSSFFLCLLIPFSPPPSPPHHHHKKNVIADECNIEINIILQGQVLVVVVVVQGPASHDQEQQRDSPDRS